MLARPHLASRLAQNPSTVAQAVALYDRLAPQVSLLDVPRFLAANADDDHMLAGALAANADLTVSDDFRPLLPLGSYQHIPVVTAAEAVNRIEAAKK